jgi:hypothetical protein
LRPRQSSRTPRGLPRAQRLDADTGLQFRLDPFVNGRPIEAARRTVAGASPSRTRSIAISRMVSSVARSSVRPSHFMSNPIRTLSKSSINVALFID